MTVYTIVGGSGKVARHVTRLAVSRGIRVKSIVRSSEHVAELETLGAEVVVEDIEKTTVERLAHIFNSSNVVIWAAGAGGKGGPERTKSVDRDAAIKTFDAVEAAGVTRVLTVSAIDVRDHSKPFPEHYSAEDKKMSEKMYNAIPQYMEAKYAADKDLIRRKNFHWTILRPGGLKDDKGTGKIVLGKAPLTAIPREDVAATLMALVDEPRAYGLALDVNTGETSIAEAVQSALENHETDFTG